MHFWHGGNLDEYKEVVAHKKGRHEYGAGLYLTTSHDVVEKYIKGGRKLYYVVVNYGKDINEVKLSIDVVNKFIETYCVKKNKKDITNRLSKHIKDGQISASIFNNIMLDGGISSSNTDELRNFLVSNGIDYEIIENAFGWGEQMMVLYNMSKKVSHTEIKGGFNGLKSFLKELLGKDDLDTKDYDLKN
jgi:hypothetical protein